jgi:hypothetical protein
MSFDVMEEKGRRFDYVILSRFRDDLSRLFHNATVYNPATSRVHQKALEYLDVTLEMFDKVAKVFESYVHPGADMVSDPVSVIKIDKKHSIRNEENDKKGNKKKEKDTKMKILHSQSESNLSTQHTNDLPSSVNGGSVEDTAGGKKGRAKAKRKKTTLKKSEREELLEGDGEDGGETMKRLQEKKSFTSQPRTTLSPRQQTQEIDDELVGGLLSLVGAAPLQSHMVTERDEEMLRRACDLQIQLLHSMQQQNEFLSNRVRRLSARLSHSEAENKKLRHVVRSIYPMWNADPLDIFETFQEWGRILDSD